MVSLPSVSSLYEPTAEEEAYGVYVFDKLFGTFPMDGLIHVEATVGLRVLESSGVDGMLLRTIWSVADPDNLRCLTYLSQFHVVLRLIALAQDGMLEKEIHRAFTQQRNDTTPLAVIQRTLWMSKDYRDCPLPKFKGVPVPNKEFLKEFSKRLKKILSKPIPAPAPFPAPAPLPVNDLDTVNAVVVPAPAPSPKPMVRFDTDTVQAVAPIPSSLSLHKSKPKHRGGDDSDTVRAVAPDAKEIDPAWLELLQEQAALQRAILDSNRAGLTTTTTTTTTTTPSPTITQPSRSVSPPYSDKDDVDDALQKAIYESTYEAASPTRLTKTVAVASAAAAAAATTTTIEPPPPKKPEQRNWLRMTSLQDVR